jgi:hypothetical protein
LSGSLLSVPGNELVEAGLRVIGDAVHNVGEPGLWVGLVVPINV